MKFNINKEEEIKIEGGDVLESKLSGNLYLIITDNRGRDELYNCVVIGNVDNSTSNNIFYEIGKQNSISLSLLLEQVFGSPHVDSGKFILHKNSDITMSIGN